MTCDSYGKLPLHYACGNPRGTSKVSSFFVFSSSNKKGIDNMIQIIECLLHAYPRGVIVKDEFGKTPVDIATENRADPRIIQLLNQALEKVKANTTSRQQQQHRQNHHHRQNQHDHHHETASRQERRRSLTTTTTNHAIGGGNATVSPSVATSIRSSIYTSEQQHSKCSNYPTYHLHNRRTAGRKQRIVLNDEPIDLDKEMDKIYNNNELEYYHTNGNNQHGHQDNTNTEVPSLINFIIECDLNDRSTNRNGYDDDDDDDISSLGVDGISKHDRKFQPFTNFTDLVDI
jgi:hypothetical protein